jgi:Tfp pilus assembly protein PilX
MRHSITSEHGSALVTALLLTMIMLTVGLAGLAQVDVQQEQSGVERVRETSFNLGEGALNAQIFAVSRRWPGPGAGAGTQAAAPFVYGPCTQDSISQNCPSAETIRRLFTSPDTAGATAWRTEVRDNATTVPPTCPTSPSTASSFYSDASTQGQYPYDCNNDGRVWVRAQATVRGRTRALVALVQAERETQQLPRAALLAGRLEIGNNGNKVLVDAQADTTLNAEILLRCQPASGTVCAGHDGFSLGDILSRTKLLTQLNGTKPQTGYAGAPALLPEALERLKQTAITNGTYFPNCPPGPDGSPLAGAVVYVETCNQAYKSNTPINTAESPGALIIANGSIDFQGNTTYHGLVYHANVAGSTETLVKLSGNNGVAGAVFVEGNGGFFIQGSAKLTVNGAAFEALQTYGSAGIIQNTWREIPPGG